MHSTGERDLLKNITRYHLLSVLDSWNSIALVAKSKLSASIQNSAKILTEVKTDVEVIAVFNKLKVFCLLTGYVQILLLLLRLNRKCVISENL